MAVRTEGGAARGSARVESTPPLTHPPHWHHAQPRSRLSAGHPTLLGPPLQWLVTGERSGRTLAVAGSLVWKLCPLHRFLVIL
jgi:hypothetical protein